MIEHLLDEWPTFGLFALCVGLFVYAEKQRPPWQALAGIACYAVALVLMNLYRTFPSGTDAQLHVLYDVWGTGNQAAGVVYLLVLSSFILWPPPRRHGLVMLIWLMVCIAEGWTGLMENTLCNFIATDIPFEQQTQEQRDMAKCERIYGAWYSHVPLLVQIGVMFVFVGYYKWAKDRINGGLRETR